MLNCFNVCKTVNNPQNPASFSKQQPNGFKCFEELNTIKDTLPT